MSLSRWIPSFVPRYVYDREVARADRAEEDTRAMRKEVAFAFQQATKANDQAREAIAEARGALREAMEMAKFASKATFTIPADAVPESTSVAANDALAARRSRERGQLQSAQG